METKVTEICECECHKKGQTIMHFMACCELTYEKYLNEDGSLDNNEYALALGRRRDFLNGTSNSKRARKPRWDKTKREDNA